MKDNLMTEEEELNLKAAVALEETMRAIATGEEKCIPPKHFLAAMTGPLFINTDK